MRRIFLEQLATISPFFICVVLGIMALAVFFRVLATLDARKSLKGVVKLKGVLEGDSPANVHLKSGEIFERVKIRQLDVDYTHMLHDMWVFEREPCGLSIVRADNIARIELPESKDVEVSVEKHTATGIDY